MACYNLQVVVATVLHDVRRVGDALPAVANEILGMRERYDLVLGAVHDVHWAADLSDPVNVGEHVTGQRHGGEAGIDRNAVDGEQGTLQHHGSDSGLRRQVDGRPGADGPAPEHDLSPRNADDVPQVLEGRLDVSIDGLLVGLARAHAVARILVGEDVDLQDVAHLAEVLDDHAEVLRVPVAEQQGVLCVLVDEKSRYHLVLGGVEPDEVRVLGVRRVGWLENDLGDGRAHGGHMRCTGPTSQMLENT
mmetsp:Transcript_45672/g.130377  ORF Transcript_45672/g.130377 Transcript_45672/m.130377 type:complete len:248 (-) Transcript_45672:8-751(-)